MIKLKNIGNYETVPKIIEYIINSDIEKLEEEKAKGFDVNAEINISKYKPTIPISVAILTEQFDSIKWLVENGADLNNKVFPSFLCAVRYCSEDIIKYIVESGANIHSTNSVKTDAFGEALHGNKTENLIIIHELGHTVEKYAGAAFRSAVSDRNYTVTDFFIKHGVDINFNKPDMVYPWKPTPLCVAARYVDLEMCKYLINNGADVTLSEKNGMRPYSIAIEKDDNEMAEYFKSLEPHEFHNLENKLTELKSFKLPKKLIEYLTSESLRMEFNNNKYIKFIDFFNLVNTVTIKIGRQKLLRISKEVDNYSDLKFVWNPKTKMIASYDEEHEELIDIASFDEFMKNTGSLIETKLF